MGPQSQRPGNDGAGATDALVGFRRELHDCMFSGADALFELCDAVLCAPAPVGSVPALSLESVFRRSHGSLYKALAHGSLDTDMLRRAIVAGWSYQWITQLDWAPDSWTAPLDAQRITPNEDTTMATIEQVQRLVGLLGHDGDVPMFVFDAGYDPIALGSWPPSQQPAHGPPHSSRPGPAGGWTSGCGATSPCSPTGTCPLPLTARSPHGTTWYWPSGTSSVTPAAASGQRPPSTPPVGSPRVGRRGDPSGGR